MPKDMIWIEHFFNRIPIDAENQKRQLILRFGFLVCIWFSGILSFAYDNKLLSYVLNLNLLRDIFTTNFIILFGAHWVQRSIYDIIPKLRKIIKTDDSQFNIFSNRIRRYSFSLKPIILLAIIFIILDSGTSELLQQLFVNPQVSLVWGLFYNIFRFLLVGTAYWMFASIWLTIFLVSQQPLNVELSSKPIEQFRDLSRLAMVFSLWYFIAISIVIISTSQPLSSTISISEIVLSLNFLYVLFGVIGILFPFYIIHIALLKLKRIEFDKLKKEFDGIIYQIDKILTDKKGDNKSEEIIDNLARLFSLQAKERQIKDVQEWPIDTSFLSRFSGLVLIPIVARILIEFINRFF